MCLLWMLTSMGPYLSNINRGHLRFVSSVFDDLMKDLDITSNSIHVWYMYLHLVNFDGKCR